MTYGNEEMLRSQLRTTNLHADLERNKLLEVEAELREAEAALNIANGQVELGNRTIKALRAFVWLRPMYQNLDGEDDFVWRCSWCGNNANGSDEGHKQGCVYMVALAVVGTRPGGFNPSMMIGGMVEPELIEQARGDFHNKDATL